MDIDRLTTTYTGHRVEFDALLAAHRRGGLPAALAGALEQAGEALDSAEAELARLATSITDRTGAVQRAITAEPGQPVPTLNPLGELQATGPRFDAVVAVRHEHISHLRTLVRLWQHLPVTETE